MSIREQFNINQMEEFVTTEDLMKTKLEFMDRLITIIIAGMGLIAALAWDEALKHVFKYIFGENSSLAEDIGYAVLVTLIATVVSIYLRKIFLKQKK